MAYSEESGDGQSFAELLQRQAGLFKRKSRAACVEIYNEPTARAVVRKASDPVLLWYNPERSALCVTQRFGVEVVTQALPYKLSAKACNGGKYSRGRITLQIQFASPEHLSHFTRLTSQVLPTWQQVRQDALGRNLQLLQGEPWLLDYMNQQVMLQRADGLVAGMVQLDLTSPGVSVEGLLGCRAIRPCMVGSLSSALRLLKKHAERRLTPEKNLLDALGRLQPTVSSMRAFKACLNSALSRSAGQSPAARACLLATGVVPCLVDLAAKCQQQREQVLPLVADCICDMLCWFGEYAADQAGQLSACIVRSLGGHWEDVLPVVQLLSEVLLRLGRGLEKLGYEEALQALQEPCVMEMLMDQYSATLPRLMAGGSSSSSRGLHSLGGQLGAAAAAGGQGPGEDAISDLYQRGIPFRIGDPHSFPISCDSPSPEGSPTKAGSSSSSGGKEAAVGTPQAINVPRLALPALGCAPTPPLLQPVSRSSRLSRRGEVVPPPVHKLPSTVQEASAEPSMEQELKQLGASCGETAVAADLAAILRVMQVRRQEKPPARRSASMALLSSGGGQQAVPKDITITACQSMPYSLQVQLHLLRCVQLLLEPLGPDEVLCPQPTHLLLNQLLLPQSLLVSHFLSEAAAVVGGRLSPVAAAGPAAAREGMARTIRRGILMQRALGLKLVAKFRRANQHQRESSSDDTLDVRPKLHDSVIAQVKMRLRDYAALKHPDGSVFAACQDLLLLLRDYLVLLRSASAVDAVCSVVADALAEVEHTLRSAGRLAHWPPAAVALMGSLMQLYCEMLRQARTSTTISYLNELVGAKPSPHPPLSSSHSSLVASDTLQLLLDLVLALQRRALDPKETQGPLLLNGQAAGSKGAGPVPAAAKGGPSSSASGDGTPGRLAAGVMEGTLGAVVQGWNTSAGSQQQQQQRKGEELTGAVLATELQCWQMLTALMEFATRNPAVRPIGTPHHTSSWYGPDTTSRNTSVDACQQLSARNSTAAAASGAEPSGSPAAKAAPVPHLQLSTLSAASQAAVSPTRGALGSNRVLAAQGSPGAAAAAGGSPKASLAGGTATLRLLGLRDNNSSWGSSTARSHSSSIGGGEAGAAGLGHLTWRSSFPGVSSGLQGASRGQDSSGSVAGGVANALLGLLVDQLLRQSSSVGGAVPCPFVLQQLRGVEARAQPLETQIQLLDFIAAAFAVPDFYPYHVPGLAEYYVCYHFGQFLRLYYSALPLPPEDVVRCRGHLKVLLALTRHADSTSTLRRTFLQWRVLDHLLHMLSLEHSMTCLGLAAGAGPSNPSSARTSYSSYNSPHAATPASRRVSCAGGGGGQQQQQEACSSARSGRFSARAAAGLAADGSGGSPCAAAGSPLGSGRRKSVEYTPVQLQPRPPVAPRPSGLSRGGMGGRRQPPVPALCLPGGDVSTASPPAAAAPSTAAAVSAEGTGPAQEQQQQQQQQEEGQGSQSSSSRPTGDAEEGGDAASDSGSDSSSLSGSLDGLYSDFSDDGSDGEEPDWSQCITPGGKPKLTGDASSDTKLILKWERHTGKTYEFDGLSDEEQEGGSSPCVRAAGPSGSAEAAAQQREREQGQGTTSAAGKLAESGAAACAASSSSSSGIGGLEQSPGAGASQQPLVPLLAVHRMGGNPHMPMEAAAASPFGGPSQSSSSAAAAAGGGPGASSSQSAAAAGAGQETGGSSSASEGEELEQLGFGYDLDEDVERLVAAEEAGLTLEAAGIPGHYAAALGEADGASSSSSELIAAGRDVAQEEAGDHLQRWGSDSSQGGQPESHDCMAEEQASDSSLRTNGGGALPQSTTPFRFTIPQLPLGTNSTPVFMGRGGTPGSTAPLQQTPSRAVAGMPAGLTPLAFKTPPSAAAAGAGSRYSPLDAKQQQQLRGLQGLALEDLPSSARSMGSNLDQPLAAYATSREQQPLYQDDELHGLLVQLALQLITTPSGLVDPLYLPKEPSDLSLQRMVLILLEHLCHADNWPVVQQLHGSNNLTALAGSGTTWDSQRPDPATAAAAACATSALRLLKLTSAGLFDTSKVKWGTLLKSGGFGSITSATMLYQGAEVPVAVKSVDVTCSDQDASNFERVYAEVTTLSSLQGLEGVIPLLDFGLSSRSGSGSTAGSSRARSASFHLVFPRYDCSLREWRRSQQLSLQEPSHVHLLLSIFLQVLEVVAAIHCAGVVHFDIKGDNLLLELAKPGAEQQQGQLLGYAATPRTPMGMAGAAFARSFFAPAAEAALGGLGSGGIYAAAAAAGGDASERGSDAGSPAIGGGGSTAGDGSSSVRAPEPPLQVVLADFGDAVMFGSSGSPFTHRHRGTELFSSPEMLLLGRHRPDADTFDRRKHKGAGAAHDVWSCGCTLYELLTGEVLFQEEGVPRVLAIGNSSREAPVLNARDRQRLQRQELVDLLEFILVGNQTWRPGLPEVSRKVQRVMEELRWANKR